MFAYCMVENNFLKGFCRFFVVGGLAYFLYLVMIVQEVHYIPAHT